MQVLTGFSPLENTVYNYINELASSLQYCNNIEKRKEIIATVDAKYTKKIIKESEWVENEESSHSEQELLEAKNKFVTKFLEKLKANNNLDM
tara:strand:+ start:1982 stop:2257 length:276 start_codon:yes stop_codon:yes gene_type:complete